MPDVAGLRILRLLARGDRADTVLAFDPGDEGGSDAAVDAAVDAAGEAVVVKHFHPTTSPADVARELEALARAAGDHVVALRDVGSEGGCPCLIFQRLGGGDLTALLRIRGSLDPGEAVTVLAPIATALARMHATGVAHGRLTASSILFTRDGSPTLIGFGSAELFAPGSPEVVLESVPGVAADREALRTLAVSLLDQGYVAVIEAAAAHELFGLLSTGLFDLAAPAPVRFEPDDAAGSARALPVSNAESPPPDADPPQREGVLTRLEPLARLLDQDVVLRLRRELAARWGALTPGFRRVLIGAVAGLGVLVVALFTTPGAPAPAGAPSPIAEAIEPAGPETAPELLGDDPVAAAAALLDARDECFRSASLLCLEGVAQAGSSAAATDRATVMQIQAGGEPPSPMTAPRPTLVERLGNSALVSLRQAGAEGSAETRPASLLLMKGEAGWRIRDYLMPEVPSS